GVCHERRSAMTRPGDVDHVEVTLFDHAVEVHVDEILPGRRAPVAEQSRLDVFVLQRPPEQRVIQEVNLADRQVVGGSPVSVHACEQILIESHASPLPSTCQVARAIITSSSVGMTRTMTGPSGIEMTGALAALARPSNRTPRNASP